IFFPSNVSFKDASLGSKLSNHAITSPLVAGYMAKPLGSMSSGSGPPAEESPFSLRANFFIILPSPSLGDTHTMTFSHIQVGQVPYVGLSKLSSTTGSPLEKLYRYRLSFSKSRCSTHIRLSSHNLIWGLLYSHFFTSTISPDSLFMPYIIL